MKRMAWILLAVCLSSLGCSRGNEAEEARRLAEANSRAIRQLSDALERRLAAIEGKLASLTDRRAEGTLQERGELAADTDSMAERLQFIEESVDQLQGDVSDLRATLAARDYWAGGVEDQLRELTARGDRRGGPANMGMAFFGSPLDPQQMSSRLDEMFAKYAARVSNPSQFQADILAIKNSLAATKTTQELYYETLAVLQQRRDGAESDASRAWLNSRIDQLEELARTNDERLEVTLRFYERAEITREIRELGGKYGIQEADLRHLGLGGPRGRR